MTESRRLLATAQHSNPFQQPGGNLQQLQEEIVGLFGAIVPDQQAPKEIPTEDAVVKALESYLKIAEELLGRKDIPPQQAPKNLDGTATSALLKSVNRRQTARTITKAELLDTISQNAVNMLEYMPTFITPKILNKYIALQSILGRPQTFPNILHLYRSKPIPRTTSQAPFVSFQNQNPDSASAAVPVPVAEEAVAAAIRSHDLPLALSVIDNTYCTTAYKRSKFLRSALFPMLGAVLTPFAAYTLAARFSLMQSTVDTPAATGVAMAGILTYTTAVATIGYVAVTTANDQMVRVTWAQGVPLWERWVREEERAAVDQVAQAWGFRSKDRWGEEEGVDWEALKEWAGMRGMVIDKVELMEGME